VENLDSGPTVGGGSRGTREVFIRGDQRAPGDRGKEATLEKEEKAEPRYKRERKKDEKNGSTVTTLPLGHGEKRVISFRRISLEVRATATPVGKRDPDRRQGRVENGFAYDREGQKKRGKINGPKEKEEKARGSAGQREH